MPEISEHSQSIDGHPLFWLRAEPDVATEPVVYIHGVPTSAELWRPFLQRTGGYAIDLPGLGRSGKRADLPYSPDWMADQVVAFLAEEGIERFRLVCQDWGGAIGLAAAQKVPDRVTRLCVMDSVPVFSSYRWHWIAQLWRRRFLGETLMGLTTPWTLKTLTRNATAADGPMSEAFRADVLRFFDHGTQRAILKLYRSGDPGVLGALGANLASITCPALVAWGEQDPYCPPRFAQMTADALGGEAEVLSIPDAGHWPWIDQPWLLDRVADFITS